MEEKALLLVTHAFRVGERPLRLIQLVLVVLVFYPWDRLLPQLH